MTNEMSEHNTGRNFQLRVVNSPASGLPDLSDICTYYDETWMDYRMLWLNADNRAIHFGFWDEHTKNHSHSLLAMNRALATHLRIRPGQRILDAGCGVGGSAIWLARTYDVEVVGITPVASQVARAQRYARDHGVADRVSFQQQDYTCTSFPEGSFDVIWAMESLCHAEEKRLVVAEARRLLRPGGRLGMVEYMRMHRPHTLEGEALLHSWLSGWAIPDIATAAEWLEWTQEGGFHDVQVVDLTRHVRPSLRRLYWLTVLTGPVAFALHAVGKRSEIQQGNLRGAFEQYRALRRGLWFYALLTATALPN